MARFRSGDFAFSGLCVPAYPHTIVPMEILDTPLRRKTPPPPWDDWLDGKPRRAKRGQDYTGDSRMFAANARTAAHHRGLRLTARTTVSYVEFQSYEPGEDKPTLTAQKASV